MALGADAQPKIVQLGLIQATPLRVVEEQDRKKADAAQERPIISDLAAHVRKSFTWARDAKTMTVENRMLSNLRARRGEYDPDKLGEIRLAGGSEIYMGLTSTKCRAAGSWIRDVMSGTGADRPWSIRPTPLPDLPPDINDKIVEAVSERLAQAMVAGQAIPQDQVVELMASVKEQAHNALVAQARAMSERMADKMEDQLDEGGFYEALEQFVDDLTTFPSAILKGPIVRKKPRMKWVQGANGWTPDVQDEMVIEWERVNPLNLYPSPQSTGVNDGYLIERHQLSREDLNALIGVEGYDDSSIREVIRTYAERGLREWLTNDVEQASAEGKAPTAAGQNSENLIDALQYWGSVSGQTLLDWGMEKKKVPDATREYHVECWVIGEYVIKAVLNFDPMNRKPYYKASYEDVPGSFWGNSVADLVHDIQQMVNAAGRAIVNNMAMASGPQVAVDIARLPPGEAITTLQPWRIWQMTADPMTGGNSQGRPIDFFQPESHVQELMAVFEKFSQLADEYSGIPRYLSGDTTGGAGRTASGLSMLISNAGKSIKQVIGNIDNDVLQPLLERLYFWNMMYADDPELKGDVNIVARGASTLIAKETAQTRRNEFLAATANPIDMQIVGVEGRAAILRELAKGLDLDPDKVVPPIDALRQKLIAQQMLSQQPQQQAQPQIGSGQELMDGAPVTDNAGPPAA